MSVLSSSVGRGGRRETPLDRPGPDARQLDDLVPRTVARNDRERLARHRKSIREEPQHRVVRAALFGRSGNADLPAVGVPADDLCAPRTGTDAQAYARG